MRDFQELPACVGLRDSAVKLLPFEKFPETSPKGFSGIRRDISWMISLRRPPETMLERIFRNSLRQFLGDSEELSDIVYWEILRNSLRQLFGDSEEYAIRQP